MNLRISTFVLSVALAGCTSPDKAETTPFSWSTDSGDVGGLNWWGQDSANVVDSGTGSDISMVSDVPQVVADTPVQPQDMGQPPQDMGQPPQDMGQPPQDMGQPPQDMGQPPQDVGQPPQDVGGSDSACQKQCPPGMCQPDGCGGVCPACNTLPSPYGTQCKISGSPDPPSKMKVVNAFPNLLFKHLVYVTHAGDGSDRLFAVEKTGLIKVFKNSSNTTSQQVTTFLNLSSKVNSGPNEAGLLSVAFHPSYKTNGLFYVNYTRTKNGKLQTAVSRFSVSSQNPNVANPNSEVVLLTINQPYGNHNGGQIEFGLDGYLYIGMGDGGSAGDPLNAGQSLNTMLAKMLRIDIDNVPAGKTYGIPASNPFATNGQGLPEIWAWGLRNPWRFSFDPVSGQLWTGDVGQNAYEEVDIVEGGKNYGWRVMEGNHCYKNWNCDPSLYEPPVTEYPHAVGKSITGGYVYRGSKYPGLYGAYVYGDYTSGIIMAVRQDQSNVAKVTTLIQSSGLQIATFGVDQQGEILIGHYPYFTPTKSRIYRLENATGGATTTTFPLKLSQTGCFTGSKMANPTSGLIPYTVNASLWHDGADSERYLALPQGGKLTTKATGAWDFPVGTKLIKTFVFKQQNGSVLRTETRFEIREPSGWKYYSYRWNNEQTDALLLSGAAEWTFKYNNTSLKWHYPSRSQCAACHTNAAGRVLGWHTGQLNKVATLGNQLYVFEKLGILNQVPVNPAAFPDPADVTAPINSRARAALFANCAGCHLPGGDPTTQLDLRYETPLSQTKTCNVAPDKGTLGIPGAKLVLPGVPSKSVLLSRMKILGPDRMPNLGSFVVDTQTTGLIQQWIQGLNSCNE